MRLPKWTGILEPVGRRGFGIFSERDYARKGELQGRTAGSTAVREVMTSNIASVTPDRMVEECRRIMGERRIRHLPVLEGEKVIGVLSSKDILDEVIAEDEKSFIRRPRDRTVADDHHRR